MRVGRVLKLPRLGTNLKGIGGLRERLGVRCNRCYSIQYSGSSRRGERCQQSKRPALLMLLRSRRCCQCSYAYETADVTCAQLITARFAAFHHYHDTYTYTIYNTYNTSSSMRSHNFLTCPHVIPSGSGSSSSTPSLLWIFPVHPIQHRSLPRTSLVLSRRLPLPHRSFQLGLGLAFQTHQTPQTTKERRRRVDPLLHSRKHHRMVLCPSSPCRGQRLPRPRLPLHTQVGHL